MSNLRQAAQQALEGLMMMRDSYEEYAWPACDYADAAITALREALAEPEQKKKPVAWIDGRGFIASHADSFPRGTTVSPLYAHPPTPRKPLTDEEIIEHFEAGVDTGLLSLFADGVRFAERAHGIGEQHE